MSLSVIFTVTELIAGLLYPGSVLAAVWTMVPVCSPSATASLTAATLMVWAVLQFPLVKVRVRGVPAPDPRSIAVSGSTVTVTLFRGWLVSTTV